MVDVQSSNLLLQILVRTSYKNAALNPSDPHWVLSGSLLHLLLPPELAMIAEGSLSNKFFPSKKEYHNQMRLAVKTWTKKNGLPSMPQASILDLCHHLWSEHTQQITNHITKSSINQLQSTFEGAIFHCEDKHASSLRIYCPCLYYQSIESTFQDPSIFEQLYPTNHPQLWHHWSNPSIASMEKLILGQ